MGWGERIGPRLGDSNMGFSEMELLVLHEALDQYVETCQKAPRYAGDNDRNRLARRASVARDLSLRLP